MLIQITITTFVYYIRNLREKKMDIRKG